MTQRSLIASKACHRLALILVLAWPAILWSQTAGTGIVTGRVHNAATSAYLEAARIQIEETNHSVLTDRQGQYRITVPAGRVVLVVSYTGLDAVRLEVDVPAGQTVEHPVAMTSEVYSLEKFTVSGMREGLALATTLQKEAPNVKNVVASDTFGNIADGNVGDFLQRLPGIVANYSGAEVRSVMIRGIGPELNSVMMDGERVAASASAGVGRQFEFEQAGLGMIEMLEVTKAPTPDLPADSIGGSVNLKTKSAFDRADPRLLTFSLGGVYRTRYRKQSDPTVAPLANFSYANVFGANRNIGITLTGAYNFNPLGSSGGVYSAIDYGTTLDPTWIWRVRTPLPAGAGVMRVATGLKLDFKLSERSFFSLNTTYNFFHESNDTRTFALTAQQNAARFAPGYSDQYTEVLANSNNNFASINIRIDDKSGRTYGFQPAWRHDFGATKLDYGLSYSNSKTYYEESAQGNGSRHFKSRPKGRISMRLDNVGWIVDRRKNASWPEYWQTAGPDFYDLNNYGVMLLQQLDAWGEDEVQSARFNITQAIDTGVPLTLKAGFNVREQHRKLERNYKQYNYAGPDGIPGSEDDDKAQFIDRSGQYQRETWEGVAYRNPPWPNPYAVARHHYENPHLWQEDMGYRVAQNLQGKRSITETVSAAYLQGYARFGKLWVLTGARVERTEAEGEGPLQTITPEEQARRAAWVGPVTPVEAARRSYEQWYRRDRSKGEYTSVFPGVHLRYEAPFGLMVRASWSTGIGRPSFGTLIPLNNVNYDAQIVQVNNTNLKPQYADNFDFQIEKYFEPVGLISIGAFYKDIKDFIYNTAGTIIGTGPDNGFGGEFAGYELRSQANGGYAKVKGIEVNYQQQLSFLRGWMGGLGVYANYTYLQTEGNYGSTVERSTSQIPGFLPKVANAGVSWVQRGFDVRLQAVWRGEYLVAYNANPALLAWQRNHLRIDLKSRYRLSPRFSLFFDVENVFEDPVISRYVGRRDRASYWGSWPAKVIAGINGRL